MRRNIDGLLQNEAASAARAASDAQWEHAWPGFALRSRFATLSSVPLQLANCILGRRGWDTFRVLIFHDIPDFERKAFEELVETLAEQKRIITPAEAANYLRGGDLPRQGPLFLLTFDDGFLSNYVIARDFLEPLGLHAIFFVYPSAIDLAGQRGDGAAPVGWGARPPGGNRRMQGPHMQWRHVMALCESGHTIGAHSYTHVRLRDLQGAALSREVLLCYDTLEALIRTPVEWFAYPFGDIDSIDEKAMCSIVSRYLYCCSGVRGPNSAATSPYAILRDHVDLSAPRSYQSLILNGGLDWFYISRRRRLARLVRTAGFQTEVKATGAGAF
jgi:peptidoglycan/xylan/chitin deacetylase (PgdA/CDA1 family)